MNTHLITCIVAVVAAAYLTGCAATPPDFTRHYTGTVIDADTNKPMADVSITAYHHGFSLGITPGAEVARTRSGEKGDFDFMVPSRLGKIDSIGAVGKVPIENYRHLKTRNFGYYTGESNKISEDKNNVLKIKKFFTS